MPVSGACSRTTRKAGFCLGRSALTELGRKSLPNFLNGALAQVNTALFEGFGYDRTCGLAFSRAILCRSKSQLYDV
jgi:hypothetical protein